MDKKRNFCLFAFTVDHDLDPSRGDDREYLSSLVREGTPIVMIGSNRSVKESVPEISMAFQMVVKAAVE